MYIDGDSLSGIATLAMVNLILVAWIGTGVARALLRQRAIESAWRVRLAHWRRETQSVE